MEITICPGFKAAGIFSGIKKSGEKDLGLIFSDVPATVAGVFTKNRVRAAPVLLGIEKVKSGVCQAVIVNSGNANCCTGDQGMRDAMDMARFAASGLKISEEMVIAASTGVIGKPLPIKRIEAAVPELVSSIRLEGVFDFAKAIMTTDTVPKVVSRQGRIEDKAFTITAMAKGSGMIRPDMATMLCFVCTDVDVAPPLLKDTLLAAADRSFNRITVDGDTSTNDTVLVMANGLSGLVVKSQAERESFQSLLDDILISLAKQIVKDGEGATKLVEIIVKGALSDKDADKIAVTVANSSLVKTAFFGEDANWGRILAAVGRAKVPVEPARINILFDDVLMVKNGIECEETAEADAAKVLAKPEFTVSIDLNMGNGHASIFTCDFSPEYVRINADYRT